MVFATLEVAHLDRPAGDLRERPLAAVLHQPDGAAHRGGAVLAVGAELALAVAPQLAEDRLRALLLRGRVRRRPRALQRRALRARDLALQHEVRDERLGPLRLLLGHALLDLEDALVEVRRLGLRAGGVRRRGQRHTALPRIQLRAHRDVGWAGEWHEPLRRTRLTGTPASGA